MFCKNCGNKILENSSFCSNCGTGINDDISTQKTRQTNMLSIIGLIVAGISIFLNFWGIVGIAAVILSSMALIQINKSGEKGKSLAISGISIGAFSILYGFIIIFLML